MFNFIKKISEFKRVNFILNIIFVFIITILSLFLIIKNENNVSKNKIIRENSNNFSLTNPLLDCENIEQSNSLAISSVKINKKVEEIKETYGIKEISLYYRDLNNGPWVGVGEDDTFSPASLLKIPVAMALLKFSEDKPEILNKKIIVLSEDIIYSNNQNIRFKGALEVNKEYSLFQVLESMIQKSDNTAAKIILKNIPEKYIDEVFNYIGVPYKDVRNEVDLKVKDYAAFFRVLFNSSYLSRGMSEKLLNILSKTEYKDGLVAGISDDIVISHKFGERVIGDVYQLHDCGIVYYPNNPYLLCVMTKGDSFYRQQLAIKDLSKFIYLEIDKKFK